MTHVSAGTLFRPGSLLVVALLVIGVGAAALAIAYQRAQTRRCLAFYGAKAARQVAKSPRVELWKVTPSGRPGRLVVTDRCDVTTARGIVHLRRGLVEDEGFKWSVGRTDFPLPSESWDYALVFTDSDGNCTQVVIDVGERGGWLTVAGQAGRVALGRLGHGLATWIDATCPRR